MKYYIAGELKIREAYNECPGGEAIKQAFLVNKVEFYTVDGHERFWQNEPDTLVVRIDPKKTDVMAWARVVKEMCSDEYEWQETEDKVYIVRFWWD